MQRHRLKSKQPRARLLQDGRNGNFKPYTRILPDLSEKSNSQEPPINWLQRQEEARARIDKFARAGSISALMAAQAEFNFCANRHNGTAIFGPDYFDQGGE